MFQVITLKYAKAKTEDIPRISRIQFAQDEVQAWSLVWEKVRVFLIINHLIPGVAVDLFKNIFKKIFFRDSAIALLDITSKEKSGEVYFVANIDKMETSEFSLCTDICDASALIYKLKDSENSRVEEFGGVELNYLQCVAVRTSSIYYDMVDELEQTRKSIRKYKQRIEEAKKQTEKLRAENSKAYALIFDLEEEIENLEEKQRNKEAEIRDLPAEISKLSYDPLFFAKESKEYKMALDKISFPKRDISEELRMNNWFVYFVDERVPEKLDVFAAKAREIEEFELSRFTEALGLIQKNELEAKQNNLHKE